MGVFFWTQEWKTEGIKEFIDKKGSGNSAGEQLAGAECREASWTEGLLEVGLERWTGGLLAWWQSCALLC